MMNHGEALHTLTFFFFLGEGLFWLGKKYRSPSQVGDEDLSAVADVEDLEGAVRRAGGQAGAVIVHLSVMLQHIHDS